MDNQVNFIQVDYFFEPHRKSAVVHRVNSTSIYLDITPASLNRIWNTDFNQMLENETGNRLFVYGKLSC